MGKYATFWPRLVAGLIDGFVLLPISWLDKYFSSPARATVVLIVWALFSYPAYWIYSVSLHAYRGQTVGKKSQHIKVMDISEQRIPSLRQALLRDIGIIVPNTCALAYFTYIVLAHKYSGMDALVTNLPLRILLFADLGWFLLEITTMWTNSKRRAFHDIIAGTVVVKIP